MKHFSSEQWADYVRGAAPVADQKEMKSHLEAGCKKCKKVVAVWRTVLELAQKEADYRPPDSAVRFVKDHFPLGRPQGKSSLAVRVANLIFDSFRQPLPAGVRSLQTSTRHLVYRADRVLVDVRLEPAREATPVALVGQVLDQSSPERTIKDVTVSIYNGQNEVASTSTNQFGEFQLELGPEVEKDLHLAVGLESNNVIIPLRMMGAARGRIERDLK